MIAELVGGPRCGLLVNVVEGTEVLHIGDESSYFAFCERNKTGRIIYLHTAVYDHVMRELY